MKPQVDLLCGPSISHTLMFYQQELDLTSMSCLGYTVGSTLDIIIAYTISIANVAGIDQIETGDNRRQLSSVPSTRCNIASTRVRGELKRVFY